MTSLLKQTNQWMVLVRDIMDEGFEYCSGKGENGDIIIKNHLPVVMTYDGAGPVPVATQRAMPVQTALREFVGYLRAYKYEQQFSENLRVTTWKGDASNPKWLESPFHNGVEGYLGNIYGSIAREWHNPHGDHRDTIRETIEKLKNGKYDRRCIINFFDPSRVKEGCLPACMFLHTFSVTGDKLNLVSVQRSCDVLLGGMGVNSVQTYFFLHLMCRFTGLKPGIIKHVIIDPHIYANQYEAARELLRRPHIECRPTLFLHEDIKTFDDILREDLPLSHFKVVGYESNGPLESKIILTN